MNIRGKQIWNMYTCLMYICWSRWGFACVTGDNRYPDRLGDYLFRLSTVVAGRSFFSFYIILSCQFLISNNRIKKSFYTVPPSSPDTYFEYSLDFSTFARCTLTTFMNSWVLGVSKLSQHRLNDFSTIIKFHMDII